MELNCQFCGHRNRAIARFCGACGRSLDRERSQAERRGQSVLLLLFLLGLWVFFSGPPKFLSKMLPSFVQVKQPIVSLFTDFWESPTEKRMLELKPHQANAVYNMLAPNDIRVVVGRNDDGVYVEGTRAECETMLEFAESLNRKWDCPTSDRKVNWREVRYHMPAKKSESLCHTLSLAGLQEFIECRDGEIVVRGGSREQETIRRISRILRGERF